MTKLKVEVEGKKVVSPHDTSVIGGPTIVNRKLLRKFSLGLKMPYYFSGIVNVPDHIATTRK